MQAAFHGATSLGLFCFYWPPPHHRRDAPSASSDTPNNNKMKRLAGYVWACDPIGSLLFIGSASLLLLALDWAGGAYAWGDPHVAAPLGLGLGLLVGFGVYGESIFFRLFSQPYFLLRGGRKEEKRGREDKV